MIDEDDADVEAPFVDISSDGINWFSVGKVPGATSGVDLDAFGFGSSSRFSYVRLTDDQISVGKPDQASARTSTRLVPRLRHPFLNRRPTHSSVPVC